jgi:hypothetical protein
LKKNFKNSNNNILKTRGVSPRGNEGDEGGGRILLGDYTGGWAVVLWQVGFQYVAILGKVIPVVCAKLISRKRAVYNTTKCI